MPARRNGRISSLTWTAYMCSSSLLSRHSEIPSHSLGSCISHTKERKGEREEGREGGREGERERHKNQQSSLSPICLPGPHGPSLSVKSQVTTILAKSSERRHFISRLPDCVASIEIRKGKKKKKNHSPERSLLAEKLEISHIQLRENLSKPLVFYLRG